MGFGDAIIGTEWAIPTCLGNEGVKKWLDNLVVESIVLALARGNHAPKLSDIVLGCRNITPRFAWDDLTKLGLRMLSADGIEG